MLEGFRKFLSEAFLDDRVMMWNKLTSPNDFNGVNGQKSDAYYEAQFYEFWGWVRLLSVAAPLAGAAALGITHWGLHWW